MAPHLPSQHAGLSVGLLLFSLLVPAAAISQQTPATPRDAALRQHVRALESLRMAGNDAALDSFALTHLTDSLRRSMDQEQLRTLLRTIGRAAATADEVMIRPEAGGMLLSIRGSEGADVHFALEANEPFRIRSLSVDKPEPRSEETRGPAVKPITWENLAERLKEEEASGFSGVVLAVRGGRVVLHQGYGMADSARGLANATETIFDIGSTPIDFTKAAILKLADDGKLSLSDPISRFFPGVQSDKASMTLEHLMNGHSGLPNFHHDPAKDSDYDLTWIDREEAVRRILRAPLLFAPGQGQEPSHSAFVLLAAVVEVASGQSYADYLKTQFFEPIGMTHTGFFGPGSGFPPDQMAVGYGMKRVGPVNIPLAWGPTSWLVMGSGGMVSTPSDMYRWVKAVHSPGLLSEQARAIYGRGNVLAGGSDRGFLFVYVDDPENTVLISSNAHFRQRDHIRALVRALVDLAEPGR